MPIMKYLNVKRNQKITSFVNISILQFSLHLTKRSSFEEVDGNAWKVEAYRLQALQTPACKLDIQKTLVALSALVFESAD